MTRSLGRLVSIAIVSYFSVEIIDYVEGPKKVFLGTNHRA
jgi:hypothetical protein